MRTNTFDLSKYERLNIKTVVIKETNGHDEDKAAEVARAKGLTGNLTEELIRLAIVSYDDQPAIFPFTQFDAWNKRTRDMVARCFGKINGTRGIAGISKALDEKIDGDGYLFDLSKVPGCSIQTITMREVTGTDEDMALRRSLANKSDLGLELFSLSIVKVNGEVYTGDPKEWNSRTLAITMGAYRKLNDAFLEEDPQPLE